MNAHHKLKKLRDSIAIDPSVSKRHGRVRQNSKIREIGDALRAAGFVALDEQASALSLCRSTTWTLLQGNYKGSGLTGAVINRMLAAPQLPEPVRAKIREYVNEKSAGLYGHSTGQLRKFEAGLLRDESRRRKPRPSGSP